VADLKITELAALAGADLAAGDLLAIADISASETKKITVTDFLGNAVTLIADATIPGAKILFGSATIPGSALEEGAVNTSKLATGAVTAAKLADESTVDLVTVLPASGAFIGQLALDTSTSKAYIWNGSSWVSFKAAGSINTAIGSAAGVVNVTVTTSGDQITIGTTLDDTANAAEFLAGPSGAGGAVSYRAIVGADLPVATTTAKGGVQVNGNGLTMSGDTLAIDNTITPNTTEYHLIQYDGNGLVTDGREIQSGDLPLASVGLVGAVYPGTGLAVSNDGQLNHINVVAAGTATKITFDAEGHVTAVDALADTDIPNISAGKLTSGTLDVGRIANKSIEGEKLADYATAAIANAAPVADYIGQLFFNPLDRTLFMWDGNVYQPIGVSFGQIIFSGTYDANTNLVSSVTTDGAAIGLAVGASLVSPTASTRAHYVVVDIAGTGTAPAPAVALAPPDIILSTGTDWTLLDVSDTVVAQLASNVQVTPAGDIASTNVQAALQELDTEKLPKAGGTMTGNLELGAAVDIIFEGANANANETTLTVVDPTADRTITLPDVTGTVITTGDTGTVTSTMIADGTIVNADINASAAIADTKLATIVSSGKVSNSATTATNANTASAIVARDASGNFSAGTITANLTGTASAIADNTVTSAKIVDGTIVNADVNASAAIAGTKISPNFGSQTVTTTGVISSALGAAATPSVTFTGDLNTGIYSPGADQVAISTNGSGRLFVDASGNIGINGSTTFVAASNRGNVSINGTDAVLAFGNSGSLSAYAYSSTDKLEINAAGSRYINFVTSNNERMRLDSTGRLGLGTSSPQLPFTIGAGGGANPATSGSTQSSGGIARLGSSGAATLDVGTLAAGPVWLQATNVTNLATNYSLLLNPNGGNVGIGTTSPNESLEVAGNIHVSGADRSIFNRSNNALTFGTNNTERARIDSAGRLLVGTSTSVSSGSGAATIQASSLVVFSGRYTGNDSNPSIFTLGKSRATNIVNINDGLGRLQFEGFDGSDYRRAAAISCEVDGTPSAGNDMPGRLVFLTTADGVSSPTERLRITSAGVLQMADAGNIAVGTTTGTKIGTATTQKLGFYNATPVVQPTAVADATDAATAISQLNALLAHMRTLGLIAT
jgi:hypothetical protein